MNNVQACQEPEFLEEPDLVLATIQKYRKMEAGKTVTLPAELEDMMRQYEQLDAERAELERRARKVKEQIKKPFFII